MRNEPESFINLQMPNRVWIEHHDGDPDARDVIIQMEDGTIFTSLFVTVAYLHRQMELYYDLSSQIPEMVPRRFAVLDTPHILTDSLDRESIEDTIDNLLALEVFESVFTLVTDPPEQLKNNLETTTNGTRATQEVAAVVLSEVLVIDEE